MPKAEVRVVTSIELRMLLKTISGVRGACGWEPRRESHG